MPRRQTRGFGQAKPDVPRWRRGRATQPGPAIKLSKAQERRLVQQITTHPALPGAVAAPALEAPGQKAAAATGAYRFRHQLVPFGWLVLVLGMGLGVHATHGPWQGVVLGLVAAGVIWLFNRHKTGFTRKAAFWMAGLTAFWVPALSLAGAGPAIPILLICWVCVLVPWVKHYRIRAEAQEPAQPVELADHQTWARLAAKKKWAGHLGMPGKVPGGAAYPIILVGAETHIGEVIAQAASIAAAWDKPVTEAYVERSPDGVESRGTLTLLRQSTLAGGRLWDGRGIDPATGLAVIARFPDGGNTHIQHFTRSDGVYHEIIAGVTGSGKSTLLDLGICIGAVSGFVVPVLLDPQEGQSFHGVWRERLISAAGTDECMIVLRGMQAGMLARSRELARMWWTDEDGDRHKGMTFFDPFISGQPIVDVTMDEAPALLKPGGKTDEKRAARAVAMTEDLAKRGRKAGVRLRLVAGVPQLDEMGGSRSLRSYLRGCNVICLRTDDPGDAGFLGISANPAQIPQFFRDGSRTQGLGYVKGPDNRPGTPMRTDGVAKAARGRAVAAPLPDLDGPFREAYERFAKDSADSVVLPPPAGAQPVTGTPALSAVPPPADDEPAPGGRTASDAILAVLDAAGSELERGEILVRAAELVTQEWGRARPFSVSSMRDKLRGLSAAGRIVNTRYGHYAPIRTTIHAVSASAGGGTETSE